VETERMGGERGGDLQDNFVVSPTFFTQVDLSPRINSESLTPQPLHY
jgi:hypothetical protein